ncbi:hypothetical protein Cgig2_016107 [Carnegiea gigantea]|uniref:Uncharacterized protein n=1 Tax=Carnegiea gigantea TaxID=171969 RepID=A0A9Q1KP32_9CARY|nr:hypothetical protein Cgig2_016107 [Carnegiea gigantea]
MGDAMLVVETEKKGLKRKREKQKFEGLTPDERHAWLKSLNEELESLKRYFNEVISSDVGLESHFGSVNTSVNAMIALLLEEKSAPYSKLVSEIYEKLKERESGVSIASVKSSVLYVGQRVAYGISTPDVDILEDDTGSSLWCWETRDMKFLPNSVRSTLKIRRICRKKLNERIAAISDVISSLQNPEGHPTYVHDMMKAADKLCKVPAEADIRKLVESLAQKNGSEMADKEAKRKVKEAEKEKKKMDRELQKEKLESESGQKRLQQEAEKHVKRREKEEAELRKQLKRKQEEAEREQRRREKEEAELKKQRSVQKQASIMERFLKRSKTNMTMQNDEEASATPPDSNVNRNESAPESVTVLMDSALHNKDEFDVEEIRKSHMNSWRCLGHSIRSNNKQHWGMRRKPKTQLIKELKLTSNKEPAREDDLCIDSVVDGWGQTSKDDKSCHTKTSASSTLIRKCIKRKQLLQFDKSHRPAFYGIWPKKSNVVGPRHPLEKDPDLDYDIDSDEEWEEEEPGESLSDSDKDEEEILHEGSLKADEEESEDGFFVPDGYLSENEILKVEKWRTGGNISNNHINWVVGVETDRPTNNFAAETTDSSPSGKPEAEIEEYSGWIRQQKYLQKLTEHALKKNQPLIIVNLMHEKVELLSSDDLTGTLKAEQMCLQALTMRAFPGGLSIELPCDNNLPEENQEASTPGAIRGAVSVSDSELCEMVSVIQSCGQGMNKVLESLQQRFPAISKSHLRNKVREVSDFVDNRWKVKKEILDKLGMSISPGEVSFHSVFMWYRLQHRKKSGGRTKSIATFFSKRCLPPSGHVNPCKSSPESLKPSSSNQQQRECTENN